MKSRKSFLTLGVFALLAGSFGSSASADIATDFDSLMTGTVDAAALNTVTTGGTWFLGGQQSPTFDIVEDTVGTTVGDRAFLSDSTQTSTNLFSILTADTAADLNTSDALFTFRTSLRRTGNDKAITYEFRDSAATGGGNIAASLTWADANSLTLNDQTITLTGDERFASSFLNPWDEQSTAVHDVSVLFSGGNVTVNFGNAPALTAQVLDGVDEISRFRVNRAGAGAGAKGVYLDDVALTVTAVPEPSSAITLVAVGLVGLVRRRRK